MHGTIRMADMKETWTMQRKNTVQAHKWTSTDNKSAPSRDEDRVGTQVSRDEKEAA